MWGGNYQHCDIIHHRSEVVEPGWQGLASICWGAAVLRKDLDSLLVKAQLTFPEKRPFAWDPVCEEDWRTSIITAISFEGQYKLKTKIYVKAYEAGQRYWWTTPAKTSKREDIIYVCKILPQWRWCIAATEEFLCAYLFLQRWMSYMMHNFVQPIAHKNWQNIPDA